MLHDSFRGRVEQLSAVDPVFTDELLPLVGGDPLNELRSFLVSDVLMTLGVDGDNSVGVVERRIILGKHDKIYFVSE